MIGRVALSIDTSRPLQHPADLPALISAFVGALPEDEPDWLEWKTTLDLGDKSVQGRIARTILGMANRKVAAAMRAMGGCGYIVVGAEPGSVAGIVPIDPVRTRAGDPAFPRAEWACMALGLHQHGLGDCARRHC